MAFKNLVDFESNYIKFSMISFINELRLEKLFYVFIFIQIYLGVGIFFIQFKLPRLLLETFLLLNAAYVAAYLGYIHYYFEGCVGCNYNMSYFNESYKVTFFILLLALLLYLYIQSSFDIEKAE